MPAFGQRFAAHTSGAAYSVAAAAGGVSSRPSPSVYHPSIASSVPPYHLTSVAATNNPADASSLQWVSAAVSSHGGYANTDGTINYVPLPNNQTVGGRRSTATFSAAASLSAREYTAHTLLANRSFGFYSRLPSPFSRPLSRPRFLRARRGCSAEFENAIFGRPPRGVFSIFHQKVPATATRHSPRATAAAAFFEGRQND